MELLSSPTFCALVNRLMERCVTQLMLRLTLDTFVETAVLADRVNHQGLLDACVKFALREENRCAHHHCLSSCASL